MKRIAAILETALPPDQALALAERIWALTDAAPDTEDELDHMMLTVAEAGRRCAALMRAMGPLLAIGDPRRVALHEAAMGLSMAATALEHGLERARAAA